MPSTFQKIDEQGHFCRFPGITLVAGINIEDAAIWKAIYDCIAGDELIKHYFAPLPYESYHMTAIDLYTQHQHGQEDWESFITKKLPFFHELQTRFTSANLHPEIGVEQVIVDGVIQLYLKLPYEQERIICEIAADAHVLDHVPDVFHITLAYQYEPIEHDTLTLIQSELESKLNHLFKSTPNPINLKSPTLCYFNDMTRFIPWTAEQYPFESLSHSAPQRSRLFFQEEKAEKHSDDNNKGCSVS